MGIGDAPEIPDVVQRFNAKAAVLLLRFSFLRTLPGDLQHDLLFCIAEKTTRRVELLSHFE